jgi:hypothetical protein
MIIAELDLKTAPRLLAVRAECDGEHQASQDDH